jgi:hypothetical protein
MTENPLFAENVAALRRRDPSLADEIVHAQDREDTMGFRYSAVARARNGSLVPLFPDGSSAHSLFNPEREAAQLVDTMVDTGFALFAGIGGAFHIRDFLARDSGHACLATEASPLALASLFGLIDLTDLIADARVTLIAPRDGSETGVILSRAYLPALHGNFRLVPLRSWQGRNEDFCASLASVVQESLSRISADFSVQAHFGKLWLRNCVQNLALASRFQGSLPTVDAGKKAVVVAAGPGLERRLRGIKNERERYVLFATDTAWNTLADSGIVPDFFVSIDAQPISASHVMRPFARGMTVILDVCGNPTIARKAIADGAFVIFAAGAHPLARYAARFSPLPPLDTSSGTVTIAALDAAHSLGFRDIETIGADFAYTGGKPYARGTYLAHGFGSTASRILPVETSYTALMFRTPVGTRRSEGTITYTTDTLDRYASFFSSYRGSHRWGATDFAPFPVSAFLGEYRRGLMNALEAGFPLPEGYQELLYTVLPFVAWHDRHRIRRSKDVDGERTGQMGLASAIQLALELIAGYTGES